VKSIENITYAFIVRIWIEPREATDSQPTWRGGIEQVANGHRVYFDRLDKMNTFLAKFLDEIGIKSDNL